MRKKATKMKLCCLIPYFSFSLLLLVHLSRGLPATESASDFLGLPDTLYNTQKFTPCITVSNSVPLYKKPITHFRNGVW